MKVFGTPGQSLRILGAREWVWGAIAVAVLVSTWLLNPWSLAGSAREAAFANLAQIFPRSGDSQVLVIDVDRESLTRIASWPWRRSVLAELVTAAAARKPKAIALDILLAGPDRKGPIALSRELAAAIGEKALPQLPAGTPDDDEDLATAIAEAGNVVLGIGLDDAGRDPLPFSTPIRGEGAAAELHPWRAEGLSAPYEPLTRGAAGVGVLSFRDGPLGAVTDAPALALAGDEAFPGLAVEAARVAVGAAGLVLKSQPARLAIGGEMDIPLNAQAGMRLYPSSDAAWDARTIPAWRLLSGQDGLPDFGGKVVLIGSTAPEAAALLPFGGRPLASTLQIQADAADQMLSQTFLRRPERARWMETALMAVLGSVAIALAARLSPLLAVGSATVLMLAWIGAAAAAFRSGWLLDPVGPATAVLVGSAATLLAAFIKTRALRTAIQGQFERYLAPAIVQRLARDPSLLRLEGEEREITALMTDVEGFSAMTEQVEARALVRVLDAYFDGITELVVGHGGLVDKIVGDAVLAFFNMPADLRDHPGAAVRCAEGIQRFAQDFRRLEAPAALGFGRTRCGIETGTAIVGDVGGKRRLDYTAYGAVVNKAARFQDANKRLGSTICIGSGAAARLDGRALRSLGRIEVRGMRERCELFEPWDEAVPADLRALYGRAVEAVEREPAMARRLLTEYAAARPDDAVVTAWLEERLAAS